MGKQQNNINISNIWEMYEPGYPEYETGVPQTSGIARLFATQGEQHIKFATPDINYEF